MLDDTRKIARKIVCGILKITDDESLDFIKPNDTINANMVVLAIEEVLNVRHEMIKQSQQLITKQALKIERLKKENNNYKTLLKLKKGNNKK